YMVLKGHCVDSGLDVLVKEGFSRLKGKRVAILANQASVNKNIEHVVNLALGHGVKVIKLFAPEHGLSGALQYMEKVNDQNESRLKIPVISLYGDNKESLRLEAKHLEDVDVLLADLQDIGSRYYTFHCTIAWAMAACKESHTELVVIDRPNPINANNLEGNLVKKSQFSFVGAYPLPNRHGFTMGELVLFVRDALEVDFNVEIVWMENYERGLYFDELTLPFISPSPNMPTVQTALVYPGMCLIEGTNLSEGRGTCTPFEIVGAPYISDAALFKARIDEFNSAGVITRPCAFRPTFNKHKDQQCQGVFIHVTDRKLFMPLRFGLALIKAAMSFDGFDWWRGIYEFEQNRLAMDLLLGDDRIRSMLEKNAPITEINALFHDEEKAFAIKRERYLHY
ncbi:MAG TPA: DUF1343 domain-containing protein, partial [Myxococcota bacterium]|nr:DUF1343 domain-containing protein [Myxococcota bacterium]